MKCISHILLIRKEQKSKQREVEMSLHQMQEQKTHTEQQLAQEREAARIEIQRAEEDTAKVKERVKEVEQDRSDLQTKIFTLTQEKDKLATEKLGVEEVCGEFKDEAEKTMADYNKLADDYKEACKERDEHRMRRQNALSTVSKRNQELEEKKKQVEEKTKELKDETSKKKELENELAAMREQVFIRAHLTCQVIIIVVCF